MESVCSVATQKILEAAHLFAKEPLTGSLASAQITGKNNIKIKYLIMAHSPFLKKIPFINLCNFFVVVTVFFFTSCSRQKNPILSAALDTEEKADMEYFLQSLLFENRGAFVLFGSKPLCCMPLHNTESTTADAAFKQWFNALPDQEKAKIEAIKSRAKPIPELERNPYSGWLALQKVGKNFKMKNYLFRIVPYREGFDGGYDLMFINIQQTATVLANHYEIFKQAAGGIDFHPLQAVFELQNPDSTFWKNVFSMKNHLAKGLLFGFGLNNSLFGDWSFSYRNGTLVLPSEEYRKEIENYLKDETGFIPSITHVARDESSVSNFTIPIFGMILGDETAEKYAQEKKIIEKIYHNRDIVEVTLQRLFDL